MEVTEDRLGGDGRFYLRAELLASTAATSLRVTGMSMPCRLAPRRMGPAIASSSGGWPCATSFCIELRMFSGIFITPAITASALILAPSATATALASRMQDNPWSLHDGSARISPVVLSEAVVVKANAARNTSLLHNSVGSSSTKRHSKPIFRRSSSVDASRALPEDCIFKRAKGERWTMWPGATRSDSTAIVAGITLATPYFERR